MKGSVISRLLAAVVLVAVLVSTGVSADSSRSQAGAGPRSRTFRLQYGVALVGLPAAARVRVWLPVPQSSPQQTIRALERDLPAAATTAIEPIYGNKILYFETKGAASGSLAFKTSYRVRRREVRGLAAAGSPASHSGLSADQRQLFLSANRKVPLQGRQLRLLAGVTFSRDPLAIARTLYERVDDHVRYDKSRPGYGNGDVLWVCDSRCGNCTDFHSLFISLARSQGLPARFEIGFLLPPERGAGTIAGYHCWALFYSDAKGWVPVDISEADKHPWMKGYYFGNLTEDRVTFTTGRDINLVPRQDGAPLNYFVYPYVEVDGKPWPKENMKLSFAYTDVKDKGSATP